MRSPVERLTDEQLVREWYQVEDSLQNVRSDLEALESRLNGLLEHIFARFAPAAAAAAMAAWTQEYGDG